jgi:hypothetical protein
MMPIGNAKSCFLCAEGHARRRKGKAHGVQLSFAMVDVACPISRVEFDEIVLALADFQRVLSRAEVAQ